MGCRTYEADKHGRITIYPSLNSSARRNHGILTALIKKLMDMVSEIRKNGANTPQI